LKGQNRLKRFLEKLHYISLFFGLYANAYQSKTANSEEGEHKIAVIKHESAMSSELACRCLCIFFVLFCAKLKVFEEKT